MAKGKKTISLTASIEEALGYGPEIASLQEEMESWRDALEDKLSHTDKYQAVSEAADTLENSELESRCDDLITKLNELAEGSPFVAGCPEHVVGRKCRRCKWDGVAKKPYGAKKIVEAHEPPEKVVRDWGADKGETYLVFGLIRSGNMTESYEIREGARPTLIEEMKKRFATACATAKEENLRLETPVIPSRIEDVAEVLPLKTFEGICNRKVSWTELQAYKGKSLSRSDRLGNATSAIRAAVEAVREAIEAAVKGGAADEEDDRVSVVKDALDEVESGLDEVESVEFPGMYG